MKAVFGSLAMAWLRGVLALFLLGLCVFLMALATAPLALLVGWFILDALGDFEASWWDRWLFAWWVWTPIAARGIYQAVAQSQTASALILGGETRPKV